MKRFSQTAQDRYYTILLFLAILIIAATLRSPITSVGPLIPFIREDLGVSNTIVGFVNTLPLLAFGLFSPFIPGISRKTGMEIMLLIAMIVLSTGIIFRSLGGTSMLLTGTVLLGLGIAVGNVLMPGLIKLSFPYRVGVMTGLYSVSMNVFGALASGVSVPIASLEMFTWRNSMQVWALFSLIAVVILILRLPEIRSSNKKVPGKVKSQPSTPLYKSKIAWAVTLFMGFQSFIPYSLFTWLPDILISKGFDESEAGWLMAIYQVGLIPATFIVPIIAAKMQSQRLIAFLSGLLFFFGLLGVSFTSSNAIVLFLILAGIGAGTTFSLAMMFFVLRTNTVAESSQLSGMAQSVGYMIAALGPILLGSIAEWTQGWSIPLVLLMIVSLCISLFGLVAGKDQKVSQSMQSQKTT
ncbi:MFS transporter [Bacillus sp. JCM 19041]|uniref:CynX/NimT family MFS transporter n=1 Tax=Bacillus sp. JCM 19041 TaxID=1460637 RepID=UPI0006D13943